MTTESNNYNIFLLQNTKIRSVSTNVEKQSNLKTNQEGQFPPQFERYPSQSSKNQNLKKVMSMGIEEVSQEKNLNRSDKEIIKQLFSRSSNLQNQSHRVSTSIHNEQQYLYEHLKYLNNKQQHQIQLQMNQEERLCSKSSQKVTFFKNSFQKKQFRHSQNQRKQDTQTILNHPNQTIRFQKQLQSRSSIYLKQSQQNNKKQSKQHFQIQFTSNNPQKKKKKLIYQVEEQRGSFQSSIMFSNPFGAQQNPHKKQMDGQQNIQSFFQLKKKIQLTDQSTPVINKELFQLLSPFYNRRYFADHSKIMAWNNFERRQISQYYKPQRLQIKRQLIQKILFHSTANSNFVCKYLQKKQSIVFYRLEENRDLQKNYKKIIQLQQGIKLAPSICYNQSRNRMYAFDNAKKQIRVYSIINLQLVCKIKTNKQLMNPLLYNYQINGEQYLFLIGGFFQITSDIVEGSKFIFIYQLSKWTINFKPNIVKLSIGRISPIVIFQTNKIVIFGGNTVAKIERQGKFNYLQEKQLNASTNLTGIALYPQHILNQDKQPILIFNSLAVQVNEQKLFKLHSAFVLSQKSSKLLILPNQSKLYQIKLTEKYINLTVSKYQPTVSETSQKYDHSQISCNYDLATDLKLIKISKNGSLYSMKIIHKSMTILKNTCEVY